MRGFYFMASDSQMRELTPIYYVILAGLISLIVYMMFMDQLDNSVLL